jgi:hypothetical protein
VKRVVALGLAAVVLIVAAVVVVARRDGETGPSHPAAWDPRVRDLVAFVEKERGLTFEHPVQIDFLPDAEFRKEVTQDDSAAAAHDKEQLESTEAMLRAVGLVHGDIDLKTVGDELVGDGVVGLYRFQDERIIVRGSTLDDQRRSTLVHELTHALQDQRFDVGDKKPELSGAQAALTAVVEADAEDVQDAWRKTLAPARRRALDEAEQSTADQADFKGVPRVFVELMSFPYVFGPDLLHTVMDERGRAARNELLRKPPTTEENIVEPQTYLDGQGAEHVKTPALGKGEKAVKDSEGDFGMLSLLVVLAERVPWTDAWDAVQGWAGDAVVAFRRGGDTCVRADVAFDDQAAAGRFASTFAAWAKGLPARSSRSGAVVQWESCDPGTKGTAATPGADDGHVSGITGLALRRSIAQEFESSGAPHDTAYCVADGLLHRLGAQRVADLDRLLQSNPNDTTAVREVQAAAQGAASACG